MINHLSSQGLAEDLKSSAIGAKQRKYSSGLKFLLPNGSRRLPFRYIVCSIFFLETQKIMESPSSKTVTMIDQIMVPHIGCFHDEDSHR